MWGCFGSPVTNGIITEKANQYPDWYGAAKQATGTVHLFCGNVKEENEHETDLE